MTAPGERLIELLASLSLATDVGTGEPLGHALSTSLLSVEIAHELGCDDDTVRSTLQVALLRFLGCTSDAAESAKFVGGDDLGFTATMAPVWMSGSGDVLAAMWSLGDTTREKARILAGALSDPGGSRRALAAHCETASMLAHRLRLDSRVVTALGHAYERWDGRGHPNRIRGEAIPLEVRIAVVARDVDLFLRQNGDFAAMLEQRRGRAYDPKVVDACRRVDPRETRDEWDRVLEAEPRPHERVVDLDQALTVLADFTDLKSPWIRGHSRRVAELVGGGARAAGLPGAAVTHVERAALVHDLGRVGVENGVWDRPDRLSTGDLEKVRLHPYLTQRILSRCEALRPLADLASSHHERLDGSGYHRQMPADHLDESARLLAAADVLAALTAARPHRPALDSESAFDLLRSEVKDQRLDGRAVECLEAAARGEVVRPDNPDGLTEREVEVLRELAAGRTNRQVGERLFISPKTVGRHIENIYLKIGVSTRAGAAVYAMEHRLI